MSNSALFTFASSLFSSTSQHTVMLDFDCQLDWTELSRMSVKHTSEYGLFSRDNRSCTL